MNEIGFDWDPYDAVWEARFAELKLYQQRFGNCDLPAEYKENPVLGRWVRTQRILYKRGRLTEERIQRLNEVGVIWEKLDAQWDARFAELEAYHKRFGNCEVPREFKENPGLATWVTTQRTCHNSGRLAKERARRLDEIGFTWEVIDTGWDTSFVELKTYQKRFGNCDVPQAFKENRALGAWVRNQRTLYKCGRFVDCWNAVRVVGPMRV